MLTPYYLRGNYFAQGLDFVARNQQALGATNYTVVWNTGNWNRSANHPFDIIEIIAGSHFHSQRDYAADPQGYPFIVRGVATGLINESILSIFGIKYTRPSRREGRLEGRLEVRNLLYGGGTTCEGPTTLLVPQVRPDGAPRFRPFYVGLQELLGRNPNIQRLVFQAPDGIPHEFSRWCAGSEIPIELLQPDVFAARYPENLIEYPAP